MTEWCTAHPYMTFLIAMTIVLSIGDIIRIRIRSKKKIHKRDKND